MARSVIEEAGGARRLLCFADGERRLTNIRHLFELLHTAEHEQNMGMTALLQWYYKMRMAEREGEGAELRLESDDAAVQLVTVHRSKGLEYPVVYCPYLWQAGARKSESPYFVYHAPEQDWQGSLTVRPTESEHMLRKNEEFAESLRLLYVAVTRAKHACVAMWCPTAAYDRSPFAYLLHSQAGSPVQADLEAWFAEMKSRNAAELSQELQQRANRTEGWSVRYCDIQRVSEPMVDSDAQVNFTSCFPTAKIEQNWRVGSFTQLTSAAHGLSDEGYEFSAAPTLTKHQPVASEPEPETVLASFPKGATAGNFFHRVLELCDFSSLAEVESDEEIARQLSSHGYDTGLWLQTVSQAFADLVNTVIDSDGLCLKDICQTERMHEMEFLVPVSDAGSGSAVLTGKGLADIFCQETAGIPSTYVEQVAELGFQPLRGFMKGFIDLVFRHEGRWYIVDYKSNHLGGRYADYCQDSLQQAMAEHHYYLQYHIYAVALHRYLASLDPAYCYDRDFGGVFYLFLRGMSSRLGNGTGVFFDRPPRARIDGLSRLLMVGADK